MTKEGKTEEKEGVRKEEMTTEESIKKTRRVEGKKMAKKWKETKKKGRMEEREERRRQKEREKEMKEKPRDERRKVQCEGIKEKTVENIKKRKEGEK